MKRDSGAVFLLFGAYTVIATLGLRLSPMEALTTVIWAPSGLALAAVLLFGTRIWPAITLASMAAVVTAAAITDAPWPRQAPVALTAAVIAIGNTLEAVIGAKLIRGKEAFRPSLERTSDVASLVIWGAGFSPLIAASIGTLTAWYVGAVSSLELTNLWFHWWAGNALGNLLVAPLLLVWGTRPTVSPPDSSPEALELLLVPALLLVADAWFGTLRSQTAISLKTLPVLIWLALRFGQRAAVTGLAIVAAVVLTLTGLGPGPSQAFIHSLQSSLGVCAVTTMVLAATVAERRRKAQDLTIATMELRQEAKMLDEAELLAQMGSWAWHVNEDCFAWSAGMYRTHHHAPADMPTSYRALREEVHPDDRTLFDRSVQHTLETGEPFDFHYRLALQPGDEHILHARGKASRNAAGEIVMLIGTCQDVTYPRRLEAALITRNEELLAAHERNETILAALAEGLMLIGTDGRVIRANRQAENILRQSAGRLVGQPCQELLGQDCLTDKTLDVPMTLMAPGGNRRALRLNVMPIGSQGTVLTFRDVTHEEEVSRLKSEFISLASHELRTPLTIMQGSLQLLQMADRMGLSEAKRQDYVQRVFAQCVRLTRIVDDLLSVSQIESGTIPVRSQWVDMAVLLQEMARDWQPIANKRGMTLVFPPSTARLPLVWADPDHVRQILTNLLDNAVKYSPEGQRVAVTAGLIPGFLRIIVTDQGIGIDARDQPLVFERFHRVTTPAMYRERGTGLGLFISRHLVEMQGGQILMCSQLNEGSSFAFTLPLTAPQTALRELPITA